MLHILAIVVTLVGIGALLIGIYGLIEATKSKHWPKVIGAISRSSVKETRWDDALEYTTDIEYRFTVDGKEYLAQRITWAPEDLTDIPKIEAEKMVSQFPTGKTVVVYYDPTDPNIAVLDPRISMRVHAPWIIGVSMIAVGLSLYYFSALRTLLP